MVRKIIIALTLCMAFTGIAGTPAHAETIQEDYPISVLSEDEQLELYALSVDAYQGTISTTFLTFARDIVASLSIFDNYVFLRTGDSEYTLYAGDLEFTNGDFYLNEGKEYVIRQNSGSGYTNSYYSYSVSVVDNVGVNVGSYLVYSNLGDYPQLEERGVQYEFALFMAFIIFCLCALVRPISSFVLRFRNGNN